MPRYTLYIFRTRKLVYLSVFLIYGVKYKVNIFKKHYRINLARTYILMNRLVYLLLIFSLSACDSSKTSDSAKISLPVEAPKVQKSVVGDSHAALSIIDACESCHGKKGEVSQDGTPFLAGQSEQYLLKAMTGYLNGQREHENMRNILDPLSDKDKHDLAAYFASSSTAWRESNILKTDLVDVKRMIDRLTKQGKIVPCASCHGKDGNSRNPGAPSLSILEPEYIEIALRGYINGERKDPFMTNFKLALSGIDIESLSHYFSRHTPKKTHLPSRGNAKKGKKVIGECVGCHGVRGNSLVPSIPSLAGQNANYLVTAMQAYKNGKRSNKVMADVTKKMNTRRMENIAAYYANQIPAKGKKTSKNKIKFRPLQEGGDIAAVCNACHGPNGNSIQKGVPSLTRLHPDYIQAAIKNYKNGNRKHEMMTTLVSYLSDVESEKVSLYYATQVPTVTKFKGKGSENEARKIVGQCNNCHGTNGNSEKLKIPTLAGQNVSYLISAIQAYKSGERQHEDMQKAVMDLSQEDIKNITTYYGNQKPLAVKERILVSPKVLSKKCDRCHGEDGFSTDPLVPRLAGQIPSYIVHALLDYKAERRENSMMKAMSDVLSLSEMNAIAEYYFQKGKNKASP